VDELFVKLDDDEITLVVNLDLDGFEIELNAEKIDIVQRYLLLKENLLL